MSSEIRESKRSFLCLNIVKIFLYKSCEHACNLVSMTETYPVLEPLIFFISASKKGSQYEIRNCALNSPLWERGKGLEGNQQASWTSALVELKRVLSWILSSEKGREGQFPESGKGQSSPWTRGNHNPANSGLKDIVPVSSNFNLGHMASDLFGPLVGERGCSFEISEALCKVGSQRGFHSCARGLHSCPMCSILHPQSWI